MANKKEKLLRGIPNKPGVYLMRGERGKLLYVGKAGSLKKRVGSYFTKAHERKTEKLVSEIKKIDYVETPTALEALVLEAELIKKHEPPYNFKEKDDKSFLYVDITNDEFPQIVLSRGNAPAPKRLAKRYGPFTQASHIREALRIVRRIFPFSIHELEKVGKMRRPCFDYQIGLCPGTCVGEVDKGNYLKDIGKIKLIFEGKRKRVISDLKKEMNQASKVLDFEGAARLKRQLFALEHIRDVALIGDDSRPLRESKEGLKRIEGYDISNISGTSAVGSMVVFTGGVSDKDEYRKFRVKTVQGSNDVAMLSEVLYRRLNNKWQLPDLIMVDGGRGQVNAALRVLRGRSLRIPVVGIAKGPERKKNEVIGDIPSWSSLKELIAVRDEAHRFAISYHKKVRGRKFINR